MRLRAPNRRERVLAGLILALAAGWAVLEFAAPLAQEWAALRREAGQAASELRRLNTLVQRRSEIEAAHRRVEGAVLSAASAEAIHVTLQSEVIKLANEAGLVVDGLKPVRTVKGRYLDRYGVELSGRCQGHQFVDLLQRMQSPEHLMNAEKITLVAGRTTPPLSVAMRITKLGRLERK